MKHSNALSIFSALLLTVGMRPSSSHAIGTTGEVDFQAGVTTLVAEGGALPAAHLGLRIPLGPVIGLDLKLDTLGIAGALQASFDFPVLRSAHGHHSLGFRATAAGAYATDFFGRTLLLAVHTGGVAGSLGSKDIKASLSVEAGFAVAGALGGGQSSRHRDLDRFMLRPELRLEFFADEVVRPFLGASAFINPEYLFGAATLGARW